MHFNLVKKNRPERSQTGRCLSATCIPRYQYVLEQRSCDAVYCPTLHRQSQPTEKYLVSPISTFPSFTVDGNYVFGVGRHPLPHVGCVIQHVPVFRRHTLDIADTIRTEATVRGQSYSLQRGDVVVVYKDTFYLVVEELGIVAFLTW